MMVYLEQLTVYPHVFPIEKCLQGGSFGKFALLELM